MWRDIMTLALAMGVPAMIADARRWWLRKREARDADDLPGPQLWR